MVRYRLQLGVASDVGRHRQRNEDSFATFAPEDRRKAHPSQLIGLLLVADGMGGERAGDRASRLAATRVEELLVGGGCREWPEFSGAGSFGPVLTRAVREVSDEIFRLGIEEPTNRGMGTTLVVVAMTDGEATIAHVGDSRCYRLRSGRIERLTRDHSWVGRQVEAGVLTPEQARNHPQRNVLTRSLGEEEAPAVDVRCEELNHEDLFVLCSDGLSGCLSDEEIREQAFLHLHPQDLANVLVELANEKDGSDNVTVVVGRCIDQMRRVVEPDETLPLPRPKLTRIRARRSSRPWLPVAAGVLIGLALGWGGLRFYASHLLEQGAAHQARGEYLHANQDFRRLLGLCLSRREVDRLVAILQAEGSVTVLEGEEDGP